MIKLEYVYLRALNALMDLGIEHQTSINIMKSES